jgi:hypothetical protein
MVYFDQTVVQLVPYFGPVGLEIKAGEVADAESQKSPGLDYERQLTMAWAIPCQLYVAAA